MLSCQAEVVERAQQATLERFPEAQLDGNASIKPIKDALAVGAFRRGGQAQQDLRFQMIEQPAVGVCGCVVELVDDDDVEGVGRQIGQIQLGQRLHRRKHVAPFLRTLASDVELTEGAITKHLPKGREALFEDFLAMRDKKQARLAHLLAQTPVIERGDDRLARAGCCDDQALESMVALALNRELFENLCLMRIRDDIQRRNLNGVGLEG